MKEERQPSSTTLERERENANRDSTTGNSGTHPVGTGVGAAAGAVSGAAIGRAVGGPVGTLVGAAVGGVAGGFAAKAGAESVNRSSEDSDWDEIYPSHSRPGTLRVPLQELHDGRSGRLDTAKFAEYLDLPLTQLADALGKNYSAIHKTPAAPDVQPFLQSVKTSLVILEDVLGNRSAVLAWLNHPHPDLGQRTPLDVILQGHPNAVKHMLQAAVMGIPS